MMIVERIAMKEIMEVDSSSSDFCLVLLCLFFDVMCLEGRALVCSRCSVRLIAACLLVRKHRVHEIQLRIEFINLLLL